MRFQKFALGIWLIAVSLTLIAGVQDRYKPLIKEYGISVSDSLSARSVVRLSSSPLAAYGEDSSAIERGAWGRISATGDEEYTLEVHDMDRFSRISLAGKVQRLVTHDEGVFAYWDSFIGGSLAPGVLSFLTEAKDVCLIALEIRNPEYVVEPKVLLLNFRRLTADEMIKDSRFQDLDSCDISSGRIENIILEFWQYK